MSDANDLSGLDESPAQAVAEEQEAELEAREAVGQDLGDDGDAEISEEEGIS